MAKSKSVEHTHKDGTKHSHVDGDKEHEHEITSAVVKLKGGDVNVYKKEKVVAKHGIVYKVGAEIVEEKKKPTNVYSADYKLIDDTIEEIKKASRKVSTTIYATNNVYLLLQDALKKVILAEK